MAGEVTTAVMSLFGGSYALDASKSGDSGSVQTDLELMTAATYNLSQRRLDYAFNVAIPAMTDVLKRDASLAVMHTSIAPDYQAGRVGIASNVARAVEDALADLWCAMPSSRRNAYLSASERLMFTSASVLCAHYAASDATTYENFRARRDNAINNLFGDIEAATKVRGVMGDAIGSVGMNAIIVGAKDEISKRAHELNMQQIQWARDRASKAARDGASYDRGGLLGSIVSGALDGYADAKQRSTGGKK